MNHPQATGYVPQTKAQGVVMDRANYIEYGENLVLNPFDDKGVRRTLVAAQGSTRHARQYDVRMMFGHTVPSHIKDNWQPLSGSVTEETIH